MWKVKTKSIEVFAQTLDEAMQFAKTLDEFVTITDGITEFVGKFGVDEVKDPLYDGWISRKKDSVQMPEWSKGTDCKPVKP